MIYGLLEMGVIIVTRLCQEMRYDNTFGYNDVYNDDIIIVGI